MAGHLRAGTASSRWASGTASHPDVAAEIKKRIKNK
jgi:hypothetical protein